MICFRIRFRLGSQTTISSAADSFVFTDPIDDAKEITLKPSGHGNSFSDTTDLVLLGRPFDEEHEAAAAARRWQGLLKKAFARVNIGADFGGRAPKSSFTKYGLKLLEGNSGQRVLNDVHGISVFECEPPPRFAKIEFGGLSVGRNAERLVNAVATAAKIDAVMCDREQLAYDLYSASFSESSPDARLAMLMMAVETLIEPDPRPQTAREHVDRLIADTRVASLPKQEIDSIVGALSRARDESIGQAGRKLACCLRAREYMGERPEEFFGNCYTLRSHLFHGSFPRPTREEVNARTAPLEQFVADLLSLELLDKV